MCVLVKMPLFYLKMGIFEILISTAKFWNSPKSNKNLSWLISDVYTTFQSYKTLVWVRIKDLFVHLFHRKPQSPKLLMATFPTKVPYWKIFLVFCRSSSTWPKFIVIFPVQLRLWIIVVGSSEQVCWKPHAVHRRQYFLWCPRYSALVS